MAPARKPILVVSDDEAFAKEVSGRLDKYKTDGISTEVCRFSEVKAYANRLNPSVLLIDLTSLPESALMLVQKIGSDPNTPQIVGAGQPQNVPLLMKFIKMGVRNFLNVPFDDEEIKELIRQLKVVPEKESAPQEKEAKIITFYSPKGGSGVTLLTANLAVALALYHKSKVVVCDLQPQCGDIATYLNLTPRYTARDIIDNSQLLDSSFLEGCLTAHASGVKILAAPGEDQEGLNQDNLSALKSVLALLKKSFDIILIDGGNLHPALLKHALSISDIIFLIGNPDVVSYKGLLGSFNKLKRSGCDTEKIKVLINRHNSKNQITTNEFEKMTRHPVSSYLPNNFTLCIEAINTGRSLIEIHEKSDLCKKIAELSNSVMDTLSHGRIAVASPEQAGRLILQKREFLDASK